MGPPAKFLIGYEVGTGEEISAGLCLQEGEAQAPVRPGRLRPVDPDRLAEVRRLRLDAARPEEGEEVIDYATRKEIGCPTCGGEGPCECNGKDQCPICSGQGNLPDLEKDPSGNVLMACTECKGLGWK